MKITLRNLGTLLVSMVSSVVMAQTPTISFVPAQLTAEEKSAIEQVLNKNASYTFGLDSVEVEFFRDLLKCNNSGVEFGVGMPYKGLRCESNVTARIMRTDDGFCLLYEVEDPEGYIYLQRSYGIEVKP